MRVKRVVAAQEILKKFGVNEKQRKGIQAGCVKWRREGGKEGKEEERTGQSSELEKSTGVREKLRYKGKSTFAALGQKPTK